MFLLDGSTVFLDAFAYFLMRSLQVVKQMVEHRRCITITGQAGIGKTQVCTGHEALSHTPMGAVPAAFCFLMIEEAFAGCP